MLLRADLGMLVWDAEIPASSPSLSTCYTQDPSGFLQQQEKRALRDSSLLCTLQTNHSTAVRLLLSHDTRRKYLQNSLLEVTLTFTALEPAERGSQSTENRKVKCETLQDASARI